MRFCRLLLILLFAAAWIAAGAQTPINSYTVIQIDPPAGGGISAHAVNNAGQVVGSCYGMDGLNRAFLWQNGMRVDLGTLGGPSSSANGLNAIGRVVGWSRISSSNEFGHAFIWDSSIGMRDLGTLGGTDSAATAINDAGQVVGWARTAGGARFAFLWQNGQMVSLGTLAGYSESYATGINASGQVVGVATGGNGPRAFRWTPNVPNGITGTMAALDPAFNNLACAINSLGAAAGGFPDGFTAPIVWDSAGANSLPLLPGYNYGGVATAINDSGHVGGTNNYYDETGLFTRAFIFESRYGTRDIIDLANNFADIRDIYQIIGDGRIAAAGVAYYDWGQANAAFLLTPSPIPVRPQWIGAAPAGGAALVSWATSAGTDGYNVKRSNSVDGPFDTVAAGVAGTSYTDTGLTNGQIYYYRVSAVNSWGESPDSYIASVRPVPIPAAPTGLTAVGGDQIVQLSWNTSVWADYYQIWRSTTAGGPYEYIDYTTVTTYTDYGDYWNGIPLQNGTTYFYVVQAVNMAGTSGNSNEASATPQAPPPPPAPTGLTATPGDRIVSLTWNASPGVTGYYIKRLDGPGGNATIVDAVYGTSWTDYNRDNGITYYYVVSAFNNGGESPNSNEASATPSGPPPPSPPTNLTASAKGKQRIQLKWTQSASPGITLNYIYRSTTSGGPYNLHTILSPSTTYIDNYVSSKVTYYYRVTALIANGYESAFSNQASATSR